MKLTLPSELDLEHKPEIMVVGGGPGGIGAAVAAAREGRDVLLVEHYGCLGGMASVGEVNPFMSNHISDKADPNDMSAKWESLDKGVYTEWVDRISFYTGLENSRFLDPASARLAAEDICLEAGVRLLFHHRTAHVETDGDMIKGVVLHSKSGLTLAQADMYVDSTGDGDLAMMAGCEYEMGGETSSAVQPMTLCFKLRLSEEDLPTGERFTSEKPAVSYAREPEVFAAIQEGYQKAKSDGRIECPRENVLMFAGTDPSTVHFNSTRVIFKSAVDSQELSEAEIEGRKQLRQYLEFLRSEIPLFKHCRVHSIATQIGVRESRRILGEAYVTREDFSKCAKFADSIARVRYPIDIHSPTGSGTEIIAVPHGDWYEIPYGCIVPRKIDNLLMGCRAISVDHAVHSSMRVMPPVVSIGQAAGTAAALSLEKGIAPRKLDGTELKHVLIDRGRNLPL